MAELTSWRLERCCYCSSLRCGALVIAFAYVIIQTVAIIKYMSSLDYFNERSITNPNFQEKAYINYIVFLIVAFLVVVIGLAAIVATLMKFAFFLKTNAGIILAATLMYATVSLMNQPAHHRERGSLPDNGGDFFEGFYLTLVLEILFNLYFSLVLWSYALELEDESLKGYSSSRISY